MSTRLILLLRAMAAALVVLSLAACGIPGAGQLGGNNTPAEEAEEIPPRPAATGSASTAELAPCPVPAAAGSAVVGSAATGSAVVGSASEGGAGEAITPEATPEAITPEVAANDCEQLYAQLLAEHGNDFSACQAGTAQAGTCQKPASLQTELKENINIQLILDSSGSMAANLGGQTKLDIAKEVLARFVGTLPQNANVALRVYGHVGTNDEKDRDLSCQSTELFYDFQPLDQGQFTGAIQSFQPAGWTPVAGSLEAARQDFEPYDPATSTNIVYLVSDGIETCGGDPVAAARALAADEIGAIVNVIGFDVDAAASEQLRATAEAGLGEYYEARSAQELDEIFAERIDWTAWNAYYACVLRSQNEAYAENQSEQNKFFGCVQRLNNDEYGAIQRDLNARYADQALSQECYSSVMDAARERYNRIADASRDQYNSALDAAREEYTSALDEAGDAYQDATNPSP